jgi:hypothetical protein
LRIQVVKRSDLHRHSFKSCPAGGFLNAPSLGFPSLAALPRTTKSIPITAGRSSSSPSLESCSNVSPATFWTVS